MRGAAGFVRLAFALAWAASIGCGPPTTYPHSPQWHGDHFQSPPEWPDRGTFYDLLVWQHLRRPASLRGFHPPFVENDGARLRENRSATSITWIGHATMLLQTGGVSILTDPIFSEKLGLLDRLAPPGVRLDRLPPIDVVVISHNHRDHLDADSVDALGPSVHYVVPLGMADWFRRRGLGRVTELDWWESTVVTGRRGRVTVTMVPAQHWSQRGLGDGNHSLWGGYIFDGGGTRIYFAGDTGHPAAFNEVGRRFPGIDYAILPIGAYAPRWFMRPQHMSPDETALAFHELGARFLVPMHWATFHLSDEPMDEPPRLLRAAMGSDANRILLLPIGGSYFVPSTAKP